LSRPTLVRDVMRHPAVAPQDMWFREMVRLTRDRSTDCLAIVDTRGRLVGVVTEEDLLLKLMQRWLESRAAEPESPARRAERRKAAGLTARELMTEPVLTADPALPATEAGRLMRDRNVRHLLVADRDGRPAGVVHRADLLALLLRPDEEIRQDVEDLLARRLRARAEAVTIHVENGVVVLEGNRVVDRLLEELLLDVESVEGVLAVRPAGDPAHDRWEWWPGPRGERR
jgi:CBS domain-containing protein